MKREQTRHRSYKTRKTLDTPVRETAEPHAQPASRAVTRTGMTAAGGKVGFAGEAKRPGGAPSCGVHGRANGRKKFAGSGES